MIIKVEKSDRLLIDVEDLNLEIDIYNGPHSFYIYTREGNNVCCNARDDDGRGGTVFEIIKKKE